MRARASRSTCRPWRIGRSWPRRFRRRSRWKASEGRRLHSDTRAADRADPGACDGRRAHPWRRHHRPSTAIPLAAPAEPLAVPPVLAKNKTVTGRLWTYVRDDQPFGGPEPPAAIFYYSRDRRGGVGQGSTCEAGGMPTEGSTRTGIWLGMLAFCRPTPTPGSTTSTIQGASPGR